MRPPPLPKPTRVIKTWGDLRKAVRELRDFYQTALNVCNDLVTAADLADETLLARVLAKHGDLKTSEPFRVAETLYSDKTTPKLNLC